MESLLEMPHSLCYTEHDFTRLPARNSLFWKGRPALMYMKNELYFYQVTPRIFRDGIPANVTIRSLSAHTAFEDGHTYTLGIYPLTQDIYSETKPPIVFYPVTAQEGALGFRHAFTGEQEHQIRIFKDESRTERVAVLSVYSLREDLFERRPYLGDFHVHTYLSDGQESPEFVAAMYRQCGYDFIPITDHGKMQPSLPAIQAFQGIEIDFKLYPGEEVHSPGNPIHILNFAGDFSVNERCLAGDGEIWGNPGRPEWNQRVRERMEALPEHLPEGVDPFVHASCLEVIDLIREANGMSVFCHPFWQADVHNVTDGFTEFYLKNGFADAFELIGGQSNHENMLQIAFYQQMLAEGASIPVLGNSDSHGTVNKDWFQEAKTIVFAKSNSREGIIEAVKGQYTAAMDEYRGQHPHFHAPFRMVRYALFLWENYFPLHHELCYEEGRLMRAYINGDPSAKARLEALKGQTIRLMEEQFAP